MLWFDQLQSKAHLGPVVLRPRNESKEVLTYLHSLA